MARYVTMIESTLSPEEAFAYMADFSNAPAWDPNTSHATRVDSGPVGIGSAFDLVTAFGGRDVRLRYTIVEHDPPRRVALRAEQPRYTGVDTITVSPAPSGSTVHYDATLSFKGAARLLEPLMHFLFQRVGRKAEAGMRAALNP
jgi:Polyketide cyclase / dehydrase and lipid transport